MFQPSRLRFERAINLSVNILHHTIDIPNNIIIPNADNAKTLLFQPARAPIITHFVFMLAVLRAIEFDEQMCGHAREINYIGTNWYLSPKMRALDIEFCADVARTASLHHLSQAEAGALSA